MGQNTAPIKSTTSGDITVERSTSGSGSSRATVLDRLVDAERTLIEQPIKVGSDNAQDIWTDLVEISEKIVSTKQDILAVQGIDPSKLPLAWSELDEVVKATEAATNTIMEQAELILNASADDLADYQALVLNSVTQIFEACSFQDITGQRITKVVDTLSYIESRVEHINHIIGLDFNPAAEEESDEEKRRRELLLHGPSATTDVEDDTDDETIDQADIDALFD